MVAPSPVRVPDAVAAPDALDRLRTVLLSALIVMLPLATVEVLWWAPDGGADFNRRVTFAPFDLVQIGLVALAALQIAKTPPRLALDTGLRLGLAGLFAITCTSFVVHPSPRGIEMLLRVLAAAATVDAFRRISARDQDHLLGLLLAVGSAQAMLALVQSSRGEAFGIEPLDFPGPLYPFGTSHAGRGGLTHPYHLVVFLLVAIAAGIAGSRRASRPLPWLVGLAACGAGVGVTYSRAAAIACALAGVLVLVVAWRDRSLVLVKALAAVAIGVLATALTFGDGWYARLESTTNGESVASGRTTMWGDALDMASDHALLGVGPGRYTIALAERPHDGELLPAHDVLLHLAAEVGFAGAALAGAVTALALVGLVRRRELFALLPAAMLLPYFLLDAYPYVFPTGIAATALAACVAVGVPERRSR